MVLLKGHGPDGFRFHTNYESAKAAEIAADPRGAADPLLARARPPGPRPRPARAPLRRRLRRLLREPLAREPTRRLGLAAEPAARRPRRPRPRAWSEIRARFADVEDIPRPDHWGGYLLRPRDDRVLAGPAGPPPRPLPLHARGRGLDEPAPRSLTRTAPCRSAVGATDQRRSSMSSALRPWSRARSRSRARRISASSASPALSSARRSAASASRRRRSASAAVRRPRRGGRDAGRTAAGFRGVRLRLVAMGHGALCEALMLEPLPLPAAPQGDGPESGGDQERRR